RDCVNDGVYIKGAIDIAITDLIIENPGDDGLYASCSRNMTMKNSTVKNSEDNGIYLRGAFTPVLTNNTIAGSSGYGIYLSISSSTKNSGELRNNVLTNNKYGFSITGTSIESYYHDIDTSNTINGKPMYYLVGEENKILNDIPVGYLGLISCKNIEAKNLELTNSGQGVLMVNTSDSETDGNKFYLNNFINNADDVYSYRSTNVWNSAEKITYSYNEKTYTNYMGNYWDDYTDVDADDDGIWDHPCHVDSDYDYYPLVGHVSDLADWLSISPRSDTVYPGNQTDIATTLNTTGLDFGEYYVNVTITSNDPDEKTIIIPVRLTVTTSQKGDLNNDNQITSADAAIVLQIAATGAQNPAADVNGDNRVTSLDALMILQAAAGNIEL
ncbi:MAG: NosD domain-containing protein, partial [Euryarchaeota archaeon]|nr:NosD domain-containing protein [Euryarchaeota archaeon]